MTGSEASASVRVERWVNASEGARSLVQDWCSACEHTLMVKWPICGGGAREHPAVWCSAWPAGAVQIEVRRARRRKARQHPC
eukprot:308342-Chlamydomonas_euryale.AAC.1